MLRALREFPRLIRLGPRGLSDMVVAAWELAVAHRTLRRHPVSTLGLLQGNRTESAETSLTAQQRQRIARIAYAFDVVPPRVPFRSDCLVQCLAGRRWLARHGIATRIAIGVKRDEQGTLLAHAWLCANEIVVTGGDVSDFEEFRAPRRNLP